jgi:hypothetical protein
MWDSGASADLLKFPVRKSQKDRVRKSQIRKVVTFAKGPQILHIIWVRKFTAIWGIQLRTAHLWWLLVMCDSGASFLCEQSNKEQVSIDQSFQGEMQRPVRLFENL